MGGWWVGHPGGHRNFWVASPLAPALTLTIPVTSPSCQQLIIPLKKVVLQGNGSFVAQELICCCCSFPALNPNPQLGTPQLATAEPGTVSPRIRAPFGRELRDPAPQWVWDGPSPALHPPKEGDRDQPKGPSQPTSSGTPTDLHRTSATTPVPLGSFWGALERTDPRLIPPRAPHPRKASQESGGFVECDYGDKNRTGGMNMSLNPHPRVPAQPCVPRRGN